LTSPVHRPSTPDRWLRQVFFLLLVALANPAASSDRVWQTADDNALWRSECGSCHMAFPPALLSAAEWQQIMLALHQHFGTDASLDPAARQEILAWLQRHSAAARASGQAEELPRITTRDWFEAKHRSAIRLWNRGKIKTLADCASCHQGVGN
jgi:nitrate/TMAO reductase-like tetraheme cytochrome c subunit